MIRSKYLSLAAIALAAVSLSGCFGEDEVTNPVTGGDNTAIVDQGGELEAGAQGNTTLGSFISIQELFVMSSGEKSAEDEALIDLVFFAMTGNAKDPAGTPSFVSPNLIKSSLNWAKTNTTVIVKSSKTAADFKTVQNVKDAIGSSTSESAAAVNGGVYAVKLANGKYGVLSVTAMLGSTGAASVSFRVIK